MAHFFLSRNCALSIGKCVITVIKLDVLLETGGLGGERKKIWSHYTSVKPEI
jgi:hypothetical protein